MQPHNLEAKKALALATETSKRMGLTPEEGMYGEVLKMMNVEAATKEIKSLHIQALKGLSECIVDYGNSINKDMDKMKGLFAVSMKELLENVPLNAPIETYLEAGESLLVRDFLMGMVKRLLVVDGPQEGRE